MFCHFQWCWQFSRNVLYCLVSVENHFLFLMMNCWKMGKTECNICKFKISSLVDSLHFLFRICWGLWSIQGVIFTYLVCNVHGIFLIQQLISLFYNIWIISNIRVLCLHCVLPSSDPWLLIETLHNILQLHNASFDEIPMVQFQKMSPSCWILDFLFVWCNIYGLIVNKFLFVGCSEWLPYILMIFPFFVQKVSFLKVKLFNRFLSVRIKKVKIDLVSRIWVP